ncbi:MAG: hypothetical protein HW402_1522 [Dehalococcoidales bacterium]|nr:hypothetical protein [Dehalococcoidales bacterium]
MTQSGIAAGVGADDEGTGSRYCGGGYITGDAGGETASAGDGFGGDSVVKALTALQAL